MVDRQADGSRAPVAAADLETEPAAGSEAVVAVFGGRLAELRKSAYRPLSHRCMGVQRDPTRATDPKVKGSNSRTRSQTTWNQRFLLIWIQRPELWFRFFAPTGASLAATTSGVARALMHQTRVLGAGCDATRAPTRNVAHEPSSLVDEYPARFMAVAWVGVGRAKVDVITPDP